VSNTKEKQVVRFRGYFNEGFESDWHFLAKLAVLWWLQRMRHCNYEERRKNPGVYLNQPLEMQVNKWLFKGCAVDVYARVGDKPLIVEVVTRGAINKQLEERLREIKEHFPNSWLVVVTSRRVSNSALERISRYAEVWFAEDLFADLAREALKLAEW